MAAEDLAYALTQVVHNFGAAAVLGGACFALWPTFRAQHARSLAWLILIAWAAQIASGSMFAAVSLHYYGETPDLSPVAMGALAIKVASAVIGVSLSAYYLYRGRHWEAAPSRRMFGALAALGAIALTAAAFLRWFA